MQVPVEASRRKQVMINGTALTHWSQCTPPLGPHCLRVLHALDTHLASLRTWRLDQRRCSETATPFWHCPHFLKLSCTLPYTPSHVCREWEQQANPLTLSNALGSRFLPAVAACMRFRFLYCLAAVSCCCHSHEKKDVLSYQSNDTTVRAGKVAPQLRAGTAVAENLSSLPSSHVRQLRALQLQCSVLWSSAIFWRLQAPTPLHTYLHRCMHAHTCAHMPYTHKISKCLRKSFST